MRADLENTESGIDMHTKSIISVLIAGLVYGAATHAGHAGPEEKELNDHTDLNLTLLNQARQAAGDPLSPFYWESDYYNFAGFWVPTMSPHADRAAIQNPVFAPRYDANHYQLFQPRRKASRTRDERPSRRPMFSASGPGSQPRLRSVAGDFRHQERERPIRRSRGSSARMEQPDKALHAPTRKE